VFPVILHPAPVTSYDGAEVTPHHRDVTRDFLWRR